MINPKRRKLCDIIGNPVASSTPFKQPNATASELIANVKVKTNLQPHSSNDELKAAGNRNPTSSCGFNYANCKMEIVSSESDSDSDLIHCKVKQPASLKLKQHSTTSKVSNANRKGTKQNVVVSHRVVQYDPASSSKEGNGNMNRSRNAKSKHSSNFTEKNISITSSSANSKKDHVIVRHTDSKKITTHSRNISLEESNASSSIDSDIDIESHYEFENDHSKSLSKKHALVPITENISSASDAQDNQAQNPSKKITTPNTGMPAACQRKSVSRTVSVLHGSESGKFMVEIPKNIADSFSDSMHLVKRRIEFDDKEEPVSRSQKNYVEDKSTKHQQVETSGSKTRKKNVEEKNVSNKQRIDLKESKNVQSHGYSSNFSEVSETQKQKKCLKERDEFKMTKKQEELWDSPPDASLTRKLSTLKPVYSSERESKHNKIKVAIEGVRKSNRERTAPISYWLENNADENRILIEKQKKKNSDVQAFSGPQASKKEHHFTKSKSSSMRVTTNGVKQSEAIQNSKSLAWKDNGNKSANTDKGDMSVCYTTFEKAVFSENDEEENGVQYATSLQTFDVQCEFIRLFPGARTSDLLSLENNQLYTVLKNTVSLYAEGVHKKFDIHAQFYIRRGVSHNIFNKSSQTSLLQQVVIN